MTVRRSAAKKSATRFPPPTKRAVAKPTALVHAEAQLRIAAERVTYLEDLLAQLEAKNERCEDENNKMRTIVLRSMAYMRSAERIAEAWRRR
jgi:hypothetical protein